MKTATKTRRAKKPEKELPPRLKLRTFDLGRKIVAYYPLFGGRYAGHAVQHEQVAEALQARELELVGEFNETKVGL